jgi:hypothetical protein
LGYDNNLGSFICLHLYSSFLAFFLNIFSNLTFTHASKHNFLVCFGYGFKSRAQESIDQRGMNLVAPCNPDKPRQADEMSL